MDRLPALFVSHGSPMMALEPSAARDFLVALGPALPRPRAILMVSAHHDAAWTGGHVTVTANPAPETIYDFRGFPAELYQQRYPAPGDPALAERVVEMVRAVGVDAGIDATRGLDHGAWVPLMLAWPEADIPVVQLAINSPASPEWHATLGRAIAPLRDEGVLIIGSGNTTHNLHAFMRYRPAIDTAPPAWVSGFAEWLAERLEAGDRDAALHAVERGPNGRDNHPTMDHIDPLFVMIGAGGSDPIKRIHQSTTYAVLAMDAYAFGEMPGAD
jgi:4,5-DOPA dioxygenase extradiol